MQKSCDPKPQTESELITIIIPIYNSEDYLEKCLESVTQQTYPKIEVIAVDNGSDDNSAIILKYYAEKYSEWFKVITIEHHDYAGAGRNLALHMAKGAYIVFCDSDDEMPSDALENLYAMTNSIDADIVFSPHYEIVGEKRQLKRLNDEVGSQLDVYEILMKMEPSPWGKLFKKSFLLDKIGDMPESFCFEDLAWFFNYGTKAEKSAFCRIPTYIYYRRNTSQVNASSNERILDTIKAEKWGLDHCNPMYRDVVEYHIAIRIRFNMKSRPFFKSDWVEYLKEMWPIFQKNKYLERDKDLFFYLSSIVNKADQKIDTGKSAIKIFVSHRIDIDSSVIKNPLYVNVRCGAVYDMRKKIKMIGDDTGDNISERRNQFCELTVQYWAWKNVVAEYYGLCHYRRYLSFSEQRLQTEGHGFIEVEKLNNDAENKFGLRDLENMKGEIEQYDLIISEPVLASKCPAPKPHGDTVMELWKANESNLLAPGMIELMLKLVDEFTPQYSNAARSYLESKLHRGYNCYIMRRNIFDDLCKFQFTILFELERCIDLSVYKGNMQRTPGYIGEILYGIYLHHLISERKYKIKEHQLLWFHDTKRNYPYRNLIEKMKNSVKAFLRIVSPSYRVSLRNENRLIKAEAHLVQNEQRIRQISTFASKATVVTGINSQAFSYTSSLYFRAACFANEIHDTHVESFHEFKNCHMGKSVVIVACGPTMKYYEQMLGISHIGVNAAFQNEKVKLDYYFTTDYEHHNEWFEELKKHDFVKFFGQYSTGHFRDKYQIVERLIDENNGRRFFQGAPSEEINLNIEYYPLMGFYSVVFQAIHFALYTRPQRVFLVGCDCTGDGYFDGSKQVDGVAEYAVPSWLKGYKKLKEFIDNFYPDTDIISVNPVGLKGMFHDVYTQNYLEEHPEIQTSDIEILVPPNC